MWIKEGQDDFGVEKTTPTQSYSGDEIENIETARVCSTNGETVQQNIRQNNMYIE